MKRVRGGSALKKVRGGSALKKVRGGSALKKVRGGSASLGTRKLRLAWYEVAPPRLVRGGCASLGTRVIPENVRRMAFGPLAPLRSADALAPARSFHGRAVQRRWVSNSYQARRSLLVPSSRRSRLVVEASPAGRRPPSAERRTTLRSPLRIFLTVEAIMSRAECWLIGVAVVGLTASAGAAGVGWLLLTRPIALAQYLQRML